MTDPAIAYLPNQDYGTYNRGTELDVWLKTPDGGPSLGVVWPGRYRSAWVPNTFLMSLNRRHRLSRYVPLLWERVRVA
jgi:hypothetical protein